jgi:hypothetical protein
VRRLALAAAGAALVLSGAPALAQLTAAPTAATKASKTPKPAGADLSGLLAISNRSQRGAMTADLKPMPGGWPYTDWAAAQRKAADPALDPSAACLPMMPRIMGFPYPIQIVQSKGLVVILFEAERVFRIIYTDDRPHPDDGDTPWLGSSIGHWDKDTLVVETRNINPKAWIDGGGTPITESLVITERFKKIDAGKSLEVVMKLDDPKVFKQPVFQRYVYNYKPDWELKEYLCNEGNRDDALKQVPGNEGSLKIGVTPKTE